MKKTRYKINFSKTHAAKYKCESTLVNIDFNLSPIIYILQFTKESFLSQAGIQFH